MYIYVITWDRAARTASDEKEFFHLACTPNDEPCTQAGDNFSDQRKECCALVNQLRRQYGEPADGNEFFIVESHHEFGTYYEAAIWYKPTQENDTEESQSETYALKCEKIPDTWDELALKELREAGHTKYQPAKVIQMKKSA